MANIGFMSSFGNNRGLPKVTLCLADMLKDKHEIFILKQGNNQISRDFERSNFHITETENFKVEPDTFVKWLSTNKISVVFFNEYEQWGRDSVNLVSIARDLGRKTYGTLVMERFEYWQSLSYDRVLCHNKSHLRFMRNHRVRNGVLVPYSLNFEEFIPIPRQKNSRFTMFHPAGMGGVLDRKNTDAVIRAFISLNRDDSKLIISSQKPISIPHKENIILIQEDMDREKLNELYRSSDCVVLPSKWETIGLPIMEALAFGKPVITTDAFPMNEYVINNKNGMLCKVNFEDYNGISLRAAIADESSLKNCMENMMNEMFYSILERSAIDSVKQYDININKKILLDIIEKDLS